MGKDKKDKSKTSGVTPGIARVFQTYIKGHRVAILGPSGEAVGAEMGFTRQYIWETMNRISQAVVHTGTEHKLSQEGIAMAQALGIEVPGWLSWTSEEITNIMNLCATWNIKYQELVELIEDYKKSKYGK